MPQRNLSGKTILVLGAYGFIGAAVTGRLQAMGATVRAMTRNRATAEKVLSAADLVQGDLRSLTHPSDWQDMLSGADAVVNCAGALQDSRADDLEAVHHLAVAALGQACAQAGIAIVQISAIGAEPDASTAFMRTKAAGDAALQASGVPLWILKPGLVINQSDYGGTALLRMLAAVPLLQPVAYAGTPVQCVGMPDLCRAVSSALTGELPQGSYDLVEDTPHPLSEILSETRRWLGFRPAHAILHMPAPITRAVAAVADGLGHLGWRSPLRNTAMTVMAHGVTGDPSPYRSVSGSSLLSLCQIYRGMKATREHRLTARMALLMPVVIAVLSVFWVLSGLFGLIGFGQAAEVLTNSGWSISTAAVSVAFWSLVDIALGLGVLWRPWAARICLMQVGVGAFYLLAATIAVPELWTDPLGPLVKILPATMLSLVAIPMLESR